MTQLSSLAGFPIHLGLQELAAAVCKTLAMLPANIDTDITSRASEKFKVSLKSTKLVDVADHVKNCVKQKESYNSVFAGLKKVGASLPESGY